jgi:hypothetical protein
MEHLSQWITAIAAPLVGVGINASLRALLGRMQSAAADVILTFIIFDAVIASQPNDFKGLVSPVLSNDISSVFILLMLVTFMFWLLSVIVVEERIEKYFDNQNRKYHAKVILPLMAAVSVSVIVIGYHVIPFAYGR